MCEKSDSPVESKAPVNGIFAKLAVIAFCLSISSSASFWLSFQGGRFANYEGSPSDEAILYCFLYGLVLSQIITLFLPRGRLTGLFSLHFLHVLLRSFVFVAACWLTIAYIGSEWTAVIITIVGEGHSAWEQEWIQISLVLLSTSLTLLIWHFVYHRMHSDKVIAKLGETGDEDSLT